LIEPFAVLSFKHFAVQLAEAMRHFSVKSGILLEPALVHFSVVGAFAEPESQNRWC
jgi:hypothetical protein